MLIAIEGLDKLHDRITMSTIPDGSGMWYSLVYLHGNITT